MREYHPWAGRGVGRRTARMGSALLGLLLMAASAWAQQPRPAPAAAPPKLTTIAWAGDTSNAQMVPGAVARVEIKDYEFLPAILTVPAGTTVTWTNRDDEPHTVTSSENVFASPGLDVDETFSYTFSTPGTYTYYCKLHPHMTGTIAVK